VARNTRPNTLMVNSIGAMGAAGGGGWGNWIPALKGRLDNEILEHMGGYLTIGLSQGCPEAA